MRPDGPTYWLLNGKIDGRKSWRTADSSNLSIGSAKGIRLGAAPEGRLSLSDMAESMGCLVLPRGMAFEHQDHFYLLIAEQAVIKRFDTIHERFQPLPNLGGIGTEARQFRNPRNIACVGPNLYVVDWGNRRVQVFDQETLALRHLWQSPLYLRNEDIVNPARLAAHILSDTRQIAVYLRTRFSKSLLDGLQAYANSPQFPSWLLVDLVEELNHIARGEIIYEPTRFAGVTLSPSTRQWLRQQPLGDLRIYLNLLLLEAVYPTYLCPDIWEPYDVAAHAGGALILDRRRGRVYSHTVGSDDLVLLIDNPAAADRWERLGMDRAGASYLLRHATSSCDTYDAQGRATGRIDEADEVRDQFDPLPFLWDQQRHIYLPSQITGPTQLSRRDILDANRWVERFQSTPDALANYLKESFVDCDLAKSAIPERCKLDSKEKTFECLLQALLEEINLQIEGKLLYTPDSKEAFAGVFLPAELRQLIDEVGQSKKLGKLRALVNRRLLEEAYPAELARGGVVRLYGAQAVGVLLDPHQFPAQWLSTCGRMLIFNANGERLSKEQGEQEPSLDLETYHRKGKWICEALDSEIYNCQWHRVELAVGDLPLYSQVTFRTFSSDEQLTLPQVQATAEELWSKDHVIITQKPSKPGAATQGAEPPAEYLVLSKPGRYLWLELSFGGDGYGTPAIDEIRVHYPRNSYLDYLPAVFSADEESRVFLEHYLAIFQTEWDQLEDVIENIRRYFDPKAVPADHLAELARWLAVRFEGEWETECNRNMLVESPKIIPKRGTAEGLRRFLRVYLQNFTGAPKPLQEEFPIVMEAFQDREPYRLAGGSCSTQGGFTSPWGNELQSRIRLDGTKQLGAVRLISTSDPARDIYFEFANKFQVVIPAAWVPSSDKLNMLSDALREETPGHLHSDISLIEGRFSLEAQSTLGMNTIIGDYPRARLTGVDEVATRPAAFPISGCLGYDMILAASEDRPAGVRLSPGFMIESDMQLH